MFTRRHEQDLAEIKALKEELDQRTREALARIKEIQNADGLKEVHERSPDSVQGHVGEEIEALAERYQLTTVATDALHRLVRLLDLEQPNFVPKSDSPGQEPERRRPLAAARHVVPSTLAESLYGLELDRVRDAGRIGDIGSGAGFPGLVLAVALPGTRVTLIEKLAEKCAFLRRAIASLGLDNVEVFEGNVQEWSDGRAACDVVTSRKVGRLSKMVDWSAPLLAPQGAVVLWPGRSDFDEGSKAADDAADAAESAGLQLEQVRPVPSLNRKGEPVEKHLYMYRRLDPSQSAVS